MVKVVGVRFRNAGKIYYFGPGKLDIHAGMHVIVETARGVEMGTVMMEPKGVPHCDGGGREDGCEEPGKREGCFPHLS